MLFIYLIYLFIQLNFNLISHNFGIKDNILFESSNYMLFLFFFGGYLIYILTMSYKTFFSQHLLYIYKTSNKLFYSKINILFLVVIIILLLLIYTSFFNIINNFFWKYSNLNILNILYINYKILISMLIFSVLVFYKTQFSYIIYIFYLNQVYYVVVCIFLFNIIICKVFILHYLYIIFFSLSLFYTNTPFLL